jgi:hypothetical protein
MRGTKEVNGFEFFAEITVSRKAAGVMESGMGVR